MSWKRLRWWLFGTLTYLVFLLALLPAQYATGWLAKRLPAVQLIGVTGTVLSGQADILEIQGIPVGALRWQFDWLAPFSLTYGYRLELDSADGSVSGRADARGARLYLRALQGHVPVSAFERWLPLPSHSLQGTLELNVKEVNLNSGRPVAAEGEIELDDGALSWPRAFTLGSYRMTLNPTQGGGIQAEAVDVASPLKLRASLSLSDQGAYHLSGTLAPRDPADAATRSILAGLGAADSTGQYPFDVRGQW